MLETLNALPRGLADTSTALDSWYPVVKMGKDLTHGGEVFVELMLSETASGLDLLTVTILRARDLLSRVSHSQTSPSLMSSQEAASKCDPFAVVELDSAKQQTQKCRGTKYPVWEEHFTFERAKLGPSLLVQVRDASGE